MVNIQLRLDRARHFAALLFSEISPEFNLPSVRTQSQLVAAATGHRLHYEPCPVPIEFETTDFTHLPAFDRHAVRIDRDALEVARMPCNITKRTIHHQHFRSCEWQDHPCAKRSEAQGDDGGYEDE